MAGRALQASRAQLFLFPSKMVQPCQICQPPTATKLQRNPAVCTSDAARSNELSLTMFSLTRHIFRLPAALSVVT